MVKRIYLDPEHKNVYLDVYPAVSDGCITPAILVIPGGGYGMVCEDREGGPIAKAFSDRGYTAFVLNYRVAEEALFPSSLIDASRAMVYIRDNAEEYRVDSTRVYAVGFSAGGHLAGSLAVLHDTPEVLSALGTKRGYNKPTAAILSYPVVSAMLPTHVGSFVNLLGKDYEQMTEAERRSVSLECHVKEDSAPVFIWHTAEDELVPTAGALALAQAYVEKARPVMMHLYPYGPHGVALGNKVTEFGNPKWVQPLAEGWVDAAVEWFKTL